MQRGDAASAPVRTPLTLPAASSNGAWTECARTCLPCLSVSWVRRARESPPSWTRSSSTTAFRSWCVAALCCRLPSWRHGADSSASGSRTSSVRAGCSTYTIYLAHSDSRCSDGVPQGFWAAGIRTRSHASGCAAPHGHPPSPITQASPTMTAHYNRTWRPQSARCGRSTAPTQWRRRPGLCLWRTGAATPSSGGHWTAFRTFGTCGARARRSAAGGAATEAAPTLPARCAASAPFSSSTASPRPRCTGLSGTECAAAAGGRPGAGTHAAGARAPDLTRRRGAFAGPICGSRRRPLYPTAVSDADVRRRDRERRLGAPAGPRVGAANGARAGPQAASSPLGHVLHAPGLPRSPAQQLHEAARGRHRHPRQPRRQHRLQRHAALPDQLHGGRVSALQRQRLVRAAYPLWHGHRPPVGDALPL